MKRALVVSSALLLGLTTVMACVDLFHDTDLLFVDGGDTSTDGNLPPDASSPPTLVCSTSSTAALATAETACAWLGACALPFGVNEPGSCMLQGLRAYDCSFDRSNAPRGERAEFWRCLQAASEARSCEAVRRCALPGALYQQSCASESDYFACVGEGTSRNRVFCRRDPQDRTVPFTGAENCAAAGGTCLKRDGRAACSTTVDGLGFGEPCTRSSCQSTSLSICEGTGDAGVEVARIDCTQSGSGTCGSGTDEGPGCIASTLVDGSVCTPDKPVSCRGTTATRCRNSVLEEVACGNAGLGCDPEGAELTYEGCRGTASDGGDGGSTGASCAPKCNTFGNVVACMNGKEVVLECGAQGLGDCVEQKSTALGELPGYACRAPGAAAETDAN